MAETPETFVETPDPKAPTAPVVQSLPKRTLKVNKELVAKTVLDRLSTDENAREKTIANRKARYAKLRGWMSGRDYPWPDSADFWVPVMLSACMRLEATLENSTKAARPLISAKAKQKRNEAKQERINRLLDYQVFVENKGEKKLGDDFIQNFVQDEAAYIFVPWVREDKTIREIRVLPSFADGDIASQALMAIANVLFTPAVNAVMIDEKGTKWKVTGIEDEDIKSSVATVEFYGRDDGKTEAVIIADMRTFDGPSIEVLDFEDVVFPPRCANLQPQSASNPLGAPYVSLLCRSSLDSIVRRYRNGTYDQIGDDETMQAIISGKSQIGAGGITEEPKEQKDRLEGTELNFADADHGDRTIVVQFCSMDTDGDGLEEEVVLYVEKSSGKLLQARYLSELWPGVPQIRPILHESLFPIANRVLGMGLPEILESCQDAMQETIDQHFNWGEITNAPFGFYRAASGLKPEAISYEPGELIPLDDPHNDVAFPTWPTKDSSYTLNTMTLLQQFSEKLSMQTDASFGRVPQGKASAMRNVGTVNALLGQTDVRSEQILRRLFSIFSQVYNVMHRLDMRFLPDSKEYRVIGYPGAGENAYENVTPEDITAAVDFEFGATMLNTNKEAVSAALSETIALVVSPLALQMGMIGPEHVYKLFRDKIQSRDLDPDKYLKRPPEEMMGPQLLAEDVVSMILANQIPAGSTLEQPQEHLMKLQQFMQGLEFGLMNQTQAVILGKWMQNVQLQMQKQMMMMQAMQQFQQGQGGGGEGGRPPGGGQVSDLQNPPVQPGELMDESMGTPQ